MHIVIVSTGHAVYLFHVHRIIVLNSGVCLHLLTVYFYFTECTLGKTNAIPIVNVVNILGMVESGIWGFSLNP